MVDKFSADNRCLLPNQTNNNCLQTDGKKLTIPKCKASNTT